MDNWFLALIKTISEILTAAIAVSSFSLLLYLLFFISKERLAQVFSLILVALVVIYSADALAGAALSHANQEIWQKIHWSGIIFLPAAMYHFSQVLLQMTGKPIRALRKWMLGGIYLVSMGFLVLLWKDLLFDGIRVLDNLGVSMISTGLSGFFWLWFFGLLVLILINYYKTFNRTRTRTSHRRMLYLIVSSLSILIGTFPVMIFGSGFISAHALSFWVISMVANLLILIMVLLLGYSVITFCVSWPSRVVGLNLLEWVLRAPVSASLTLALVTIVRRSSGVLGINPGGWTSLLMVIMIIVLEGIVTLIMPWIKKSSISGYGGRDYEMMIGLENMVVSSSELKMFLESIISALCDKFQAKGVLISAQDLNGNVEAYVTVGEVHWTEYSDLSREIEAAGPITDAQIDVADGFLQPIFYQDSESGQSWLLAILGIHEPAVEWDDPDVIDAMDVAIEKIRAVLWQRAFVHSTFSVLKEISSDQTIRSYRKVSLLNASEMLNRDSSSDPEQVSGWVRDALTHYWGGPKLTESPLIDLEIVRQEMNGDPNSATNALRTVLKRGIEQIRPEGDRNITGEWTLYNILDLKFIEGGKVKEVSRKLSISEADLYRKQKVAIDELAKTIIRMEHENRKPQLH